MRILTYSTADYTLEEARQLNIDIIPLKVVIDGKEYKDRIDIQSEEFYKQLVQSSTLPTTSQPSPQDFMDYILKAKENNEPIIMILLSSQFSGTYQSAKLAADLCEYDKVYIIDSQTTTLALRLLVDKAISMRDNNEDVEMIVEIIETLKEKVAIFAIVDTLEYLYKGGRLSRTSAMAGTLLKIKPVIGVDKGKLDVFSKARGLSKATLELVSVIHDHGDIDLSQNIYFGFTGEEKSMEKFNDILDEAFSVGKVESKLIGPVIGTHVGPGGKAIAYFKK